MEQIFIVISDSSLNTLCQHLTQILVTGSRVTGQADPFQDKVCRITINEVSISRKLMGSESLNEAQPQIQIPAAFRF